MNKKDLGNIFYVYVYLDPRKPGKYVYGQYEFDYEPFYVGKGVGNRLYGHLIESYEFKDTNKFKCNKIRKIKNQTNQDPIVIKYQEDLLEEDSFKLEIDMIKVIGRFNIKSGPLTNLTDGGEGTSGRILTKEQTIFNSKKMLTFWENMNEEERKVQIAKMSKPKTIKRNDEENDKISIRTKLWWTEERKLERSVRYSGPANSNAKYKYLIYKDGEFLMETLDIKKFCKDNGYPYSYVNETIRNNKKYKNYSISRVLKEVV